MIFGFALFYLGYAVFYWGLHHFPQYKNERYSLWCVLGINKAASIGTTVQLNPQGSQAQQQPTPGQVPMIPVQS